MSVVQTEDSVLSGSAPSGVVRGSAPDASLSFDFAADLDHRPSFSRFDREAHPKPVSLERGGTTSQSGQAEIWSKQTLWKESIVAKLLSVGRNEEANKLANCHTQISYATCTGCRKKRKFFNRCDILYCPECAPRLTAERRESIEWWTKTITQPKHVVLTARNIATISEDYVRSIKDAFSSLRRSKFARNWIGGFYSLEVTNEGRGWHIHIHALVDAKWIDQAELARQWAKRVGQDFAIVYVKDCREKSYLQEVSKYAVKGSELASWSASDIAAFIDAFANTRTFSVFGSLYGKRTEWKEWIEAGCSERGQCECGCNSWVIRTDLEQEWHDATFGPTTQSPPPARLTQPVPEFEFAANVFNLAFTSPLGAYAH